MPLGVTAANVNAVNGGSWTQAQVDAAAGILEGRLGWHVAPERTETLKVNATGSPTLVLPSLKVAEVTAVTKLQDGTAYDDWILVGQVDDLQLLEQTWGCWPRAWLAVTLTHGYSSTPADLLQAVDAMCLFLTEVDPSLVSERIDDWAGTYRSSAESTPTVAAAISRYGLPKVG